MPLDGFVAGQLSREFNNVLYDAKINKIYQPTSNDIVFELYTKTLGSARLFLCTAPAYIAFSNLSFETPKNPSGLCMLLRKHLQNGRIIAVRQLAHERILALDIESYDLLDEARLRTVICELTGKNANIILIDENNVILDSLKHVDEAKSSVRRILPREIYQLPPSDKLNPLTMNAEAFSNAFAAFGDLSPEERIVRIIEGAGKDYAAFVCARAENDSADALYSVIHHTADTMPEKYLLFSRDNVPFDYYFADIYCDDKTVNAITYSDLHLLMRDFYDEKKTANALVRASERVQTALRPRAKRANEKLRKLEKELSNSEKSEQSNLYGQLLLTYGHEVPQGADRFTAQNIFESDGGDVTIPLDSTKTAYENAERYFKKYKKQRSAAEHIAEQIRLTQAEIEFINDQLFYTSEAKTVADIEEIIDLLTEEGYIKRQKTGGSARQQTVSMPHHFLSTDGFDIYVGKNDAQNEELTHKFAKKNDIWLHSKIIAGSHVIIKTGGKQAPKNTLLEAANLAAFFSKGRHSQNVPIDYTAAGYVRKIRGAPKGKVTYSNHTTLYITPDEALVKSLKTL